MSNGKPRECWDHNSVLAAEQKDRLALQHATEPSGLIPNYRIPPSRQTRRVSSSCSSSPCCRDVAQWWQQTAGLARLAEGARGKHVNAWLGIQLLGQISQCQLLVRR
eukprot:6189324-Amphidinium_carterae.1